MASIDASSFEQALRALDDLHAEVVPTRAHGGRRAAARALACATDERVAGPGVRTPSQ
ncbi:MAG: hypothetical protein U5L11_06245 [Arhodomonas sp.]|nr:hypothetical protein [Arhodomonas sp.]